MLSVALDTFAMVRPVFLDVDNTLLDNDAAKAALEAAIADQVPDPAARSFWEQYELVREAEDYVDFPATIARVAVEHPAGAARIARILDELPYREFVYPGVFEMSDRLWRIALPVILSDGDPVFQPLKIERAGLTAAVRGNVLIYVHKERQLAAITARFSGPRPVFADDKARILGHVEQQLPSALTVHVRQGRYADDPVDPGDPPPDVEIARIAELDAAIA